VRCRTLGVTLDERNGCGVGVGVRCSGDVKEWKLFGEPVR